MPSKKNRCIRKLQQKSKKFKITKGRSAKRLIKCSDGTKEPLIIRNIELLPFSSGNQNKRRDRADSDLLIEEGVFSETEETDPDIIEPNSLVGPIATDALVPYVKRIPYVEKISLNDLYEKYKEMVLNEPTLKAYKSTKGNKVRISVLENKKLNSDDLNKRDDKGQTLLHFVADEERRIIATYPHTDKSVLMQSKNNFVNISKMYILDSSFAKTTINMTDSDGETPLSLAIINLPYSRNPVKVEHILNSYELNDDTKKHALEKYEEIIKIEPAYNNILIESKLSPKKASTMFFGLIPI